MFVQDINNSAIREGDVWNIGIIDHNKNMLHLSINGKKEFWKLQKLQQLPFQHMRDEILALSQRDQIKFKSDSPKHDIVRDGKAVLTTISDTHLILKMSNGKSLQLSRSDPLARMIDHSYTITTHVSQGITKDHVVGVLRPNTTATNQPAVEVMFTRAVHGLNVYTPDTANTIDAVLSNHGSHRIAVQINTDSNKNLLDRLRQNRENLQADRDLTRSKPDRAKRLNPIPTPDNIETVTSSAEDYEDWRPKRINDHSIPDEKYKDWRLNMETKTSSTPHNKLDRK